MRRSRRFNLVLLLLLAAVTAGGVTESAQAEAFEHRVLIDSDIDVGTGCDVAVDELGYAGGPFGGVEHVLTFLVSAEVQLPTVTGVYRQICHGATLGEPLWISGGAWAVGTDGGFAGSDVVEGAILRAELGNPSSVRLAFSSGTPDARQDLLQTVSGHVGGPPIVVAIHTALPAAGGLAHVAIALLLGFATFLMLRRRGSRSSALLVALAVGCLTAAVARAATIALDGQPGDWNAATRVAVDSTGDSLGGSAGDLAAAFVTSDGQNVYVRLDLANVNPTCSTSVDADLDGANQCDDCNDTDGSIFPGAIESCNGVDDDCDRQADEDFDADLDGFSACDPDPLRRDCDDGTATVSPASLETCGGGAGNGIDEDCDGYVDEVCSGCDPLDPDGDGFSGCDGDCDQLNFDARPGGVEVCDGLDTDCHSFTTANCAVGDECNWPSASDVCSEDSLCVCQVDEAGSCTGNYICQDYCNTSATGPLGDGCAATQTCRLRLLHSADVHGCDETASAPGTTEAGLSCSTDPDCRSLNCARIALGPAGQICLDHCGSDAYCSASGVVCRPVRDPSEINVSCWPLSSSAIGVTAVGDACSADSECDHGFCSQTTGACSEACCSDSDCPSGFSCSLQGDFVSSSFVYPEPDAPFCTQNEDCATGVCFIAQNECAHRLVETVRQCIADVPSQGQRAAGAACSQNDECQSQFCDAALGVCVEACCSDASCPLGLSCQLQFVESRDPAVTGESLVTSARICISTPRETVWKRK